MATTIVLTLNLILCHPSKVSIICYFIKECCQHLEKHNILSARLAIYCMGKN